MIDERERSLRLDGRSAPGADLYDPANEHDGCGVGLVASLRGGAGHDVVRKAIETLENLEHRGAEGADASTGDGAGILMQVPDAFFRVALDAELPEPGRYGVGVCFLPQGEAERGWLEQLVEETVRREGQRVIAWRDVPVEREHVGRAAWEDAPCVRQVFVAASDELRDQDAFERKLYVIRRLVEQAADASIAFPSFSSRTIVYKGMLTAPQLPRAYPDLLDERVASRIALVHSRFSTNTFPSWKLAHPYRLICHNGEINTLRGNVNWMRARESELTSDLFGDDLHKVLPAIQLGVSDSATIDNVLELLVLAGRSLPHALMMMIPEAFEKHDEMPARLREFYAYHSCLMEPWDGPALVAFTDGRVGGAMLDRNGLRPGRWEETDDGYVVFASESGALVNPPETVVRRGRVRPGEIFLVDAEAGRLIESAELKADIAGRRPYGVWFGDRAVHIDRLHDPVGLPPAREPLRNRQLVFGYTQEELKVIVSRMAAEGQEPTGSMGADVALAVMSDRQPPLFNYFKQLFAQVTNPAIDPLRESIVMSVGMSLGPERNLFAETPQHARRLLIDRPVLTDSQLARIRENDLDGLRAETVDIAWPVGDGPAGLVRALNRCFREVDRAVSEGAGIVILSDRGAGAARVPIPALLATSAVHHHMVRNGTRLRASLVVESGEPRDVHHMATLIGYGAQAVNPYLVLESVVEVLDEGLVDADVDRVEAIDRTLSAIDKGLLKILSKMGISTIHSYCGAQIFEAVGLNRDLVNRYFPGTASQIEGIGLEQVAVEAIARHQRAYPGNGHPAGLPAAMGGDDTDLPADATAGRTASNGLPPDLPVGGYYAWRRFGERHMWDPDTVARLRNVAQSGDPVEYEEFARLCNEENAAKGLLRGLLELRPAPAPVPLEEVEPASEVCRRFATGGMSLGALSPEAHETLAIAMNRLGGRSNTGEGGEDPRRYAPDGNGDLRRSSIKQVASGRFGVTIEYLVNCDELQIKVAQGAKPGEGGQLPGGKVDEYIAWLRYSTPGVGLISPPPHHDIYSIEDLKQLIYDLRCANPDARVSVKLVSEVGCGTVAAGVAKANADHVVIAGHDGGTGASPMSSIHYAGTPWEIGLAETQQTLLRNGLRDRIAVEVDGQMRTGRDVVIAAILGADEMAFSTAPLIATGCIMMRVCHMNTCPVGVATQDPVLRERFEGTPEHVVTYLLHVAEEARRIMSTLGVRSLAELIGHTEHLRMQPAIDHWKARGIDLSRILAVPRVPDDMPRRRVKPPPPVLDDHLDHELIEACLPAITDGEPVELERRIRNVNRTVGGLLSSTIARRVGPEGLPEGSIRVAFEGSAGQTFAAWLISGVEFSLRGDTNDYAGKGMSGGVLAVAPHPDARFVAEENVVCGNTVLYGATRGRAFFRGLAGERFAVRNSGVDAVAEGVGDHGCEYMTGGRVVVLGPTGRNFAAGMSGGVAYVLDSDGRFAGRCNTELVALERVEDPGEAEQLRELISEHRERTGSKVAQRVLGEWEETLPRFVKVMPTDYRRALEQLAEREAAGEPAGALAGPRQPAGTRR